MKKYMKTIRNSLFIGSLVLGIVACSKSEIQPSIPQEEISKEPEEVLYSYELPIADNEDTRTLFSSDKTRLIWESGDALGVYAKVEPNTSVNKESPVNTGVSPRKVTVKSSIPITVGSTLYAYYPYSDSNDSKPYTAVTLRIWPEQRQDASGLNTDAMPMVAIPYEVTTDMGKEGNASLQMVGLGSVVCFRIFNSAGSDDNIEKVDLITTSGIAGDFTYDLSNPKFDGETVTAAAPTGLIEKRIRTTLASSLSLSGATDKTTGQEVYMIVAPGTYSGEIQIYLTDKNGNRKVCKRSFSDVEFNRNHRRFINFNINGGTTITSDTGIWDADDLMDAIAANNAGNDCSQYMVDEELAIMDDIDMSEVSTRFSTLRHDLNGRYHHLTNWSSNSPLCSSFASSSITLKDLIIDESCTFTITSGTGSAWLVGTNSGTVTGCISYGDFRISSLTSGGQSVGGMVIENNSGGAVSNCNNFGNFDLTDNAVDQNVFLGGIVGKNLGSVSNCSNEGNITIDDVTSILMVGGIIGKVTGGSVDQCSNSGNISIETSQQADNHENEVGGIVGDMPEGTISSFTNLTNTGNIYFEKSMSSNSNQTDNIGGICGRCGCTITGTYLYNEGDITVSSFGRGAVGGIFGWGVDVTINSSGESVFKVWNKGDITVTGESRNNTRAGVGGIVGIGNKPVYRAYNEGNITVTGTHVYYPRVGGIIGSLEVWGQLIQNCENKSGVTISVTSANKTDVGGIAGYLTTGGNNDTNIMESCKNYGAGIEVESTTGACQVGGLVGYGNVGINYNGDNRCPITVTSGGDVRVGGIRGGDSDGSTRCNSCQNRGRISVYASGTATRVAGIAGQENGQINTSNNTGSIYVESSAASNWIGGLAARMGAAYCSGINNANISFKYTGNGSGSPFIRAGLMAGEHYGTTIYFGTATGTLSLQDCNSVTKSVGAIIGLYSGSGSVKLGNNPTTSELNVSKTKTNINGTYPNVSNYKTFPTTNGVLIGRITASSSSISYITSGQEVLKLID